MTLAFGEWSDAFRTEEKVFDVNKRTLEMLGGAPRKNKDILLCSVIHLASCKNNAATTFMCIAQLQRTSRATASYGWMPYALHPQAMASRLASSLPSPYVNIRRAVF